MQTDTAALRVRLVQSLSSGGPDLSSTHCGALTNHAYVWHANSAYLPSSSNTRTRKPS